jgi:hypothetical protein
VTEDQADLENAELLAVIGDAWPRGPRQPMRSPMTRRASEPGPARRIGGAACCGSAVSGCCGPGRQSAGPAHPWRWWGSRCWR